MTFKVINNYTGETVQEENTRAQAEQAVKDLNEHEQTVALRVANGDENAKLAGWKQGRPYTYRVETVWPDLLPQNEEA